MLVLAQAAVAWGVLAAALLQQVLLQILAQEVVVRALLL
jgi:hypothetical protein